MKYTETILTFRLYPSGSFFFLKRQILKAKLNNNQKQQKKICLGSTSCVIIKYHNLIISLQKKNSSPILKYIVQTGCISINQIRERSCTAVRTLTVKLCSLMHTCTPYFVNLCDDTACLQKATCPVW